MAVLPVCICVPHTCLVSRRPEEDIGSPVTELQLKTAMWVWELKQVLQKSSQCTLLSYLSILWWSFSFFKILLSKPFVISVCLCFVTSELLLLFYMIGFPGSYSIWFVSLKILFSSCFTCIFYVSCFNHICWPFALCLCAYTKHSASVSTSNLKEYVFCPYAEREWALHSRVEGGSVYKGTCWLIACLCLLGEQSVLYVLMYVDELLHYSPPTFLPFFLSFLILP